MKQFNCGDVVPGCQWVTRNEDDEELSARSPPTPARPTGWTRSRPRSWTRSRDVITEV